MCLLVGIEGWSKI